MPAKKKSAPKPAVKKAAKSTGKKSALEKAASKPAARSAAKSVKSIPDGMTAITPHLICAGAAAAIEFYRKAFGAVSEGAMSGPNGKIMHAQIRIGGASVMLVDEMPEWGALGPKSLKGSPVTIHLYVRDADATVAKAVAAGAKITMPLMDAFWGDRYGKIEDPFGHSWSVATHKQDLTPQQIQEGMTKACG